MLPNPWTNLVVVEYGTKLRHDVQKLHCSSQLVVVYWKQNYSIILRTISQHASQSMEKYKLFTGNKTTASF
jgi:hypothetical protein